MQPNSTSPLPPPEPPSSARAINLKWILAGAGVGMLLLTACLVLLLILAPALLRNLEPETQSRLVRRLPFLRSLIPTEVVRMLPTVAATNAEAIALLGPATATATNPVILVVTATAQPATATVTIPTTAPTTIPTTAPSTVSNTINAASTARPATVLPTSATRIVVMPSATLTPNQAASQSASLATPQPSATHTTPADQLATVVQLTLTSLNGSTATLPPTLTATIPPATALPTQLPTLTATASTTPLPTLIPTATNDPLRPATYSLDGTMKWEPQLWNNCGPANLLQGLRFYGIRESQAAIAQALKPNQEDKNVGSDELVRYVNERIPAERKLRALVRYGGNIDLLKRLIAARFATIIETGFFDPDEPEKGWLGHYLTLIGYDDASGSFARLDTLKGVTTEAYGLTDDLWKHFNRPYIVIYEQDREAEVFAILGPNADTQFNAGYALDLARAEAVRNPQDEYAWFNMGSSFTMLKRYRDAALAYDQAFSFNRLPYRLTWYEFGFYEAYYQTRQYDRLIALATYNIETSKAHEETPFYWRALAYAAQGRTPEALADLQTSLAFNRNFDRATVAKAQIENGTFRPPKG